MKIYLSKPVSDKYSTNKVVYREIVCSQRGKGVLCAGLVKPVFFLLTLFV